MMTDAEMIGKTVRYPAGRARIVACSQLLRIAVLEKLDDDGNPTGGHATADPNTFNIAFPENA